MDYLLSILSIIMIYLMGCKWKYTPIYGILVQVLWVIYVANTEQYGLIYGVIGYLIVHLINTYKWLNLGKSIKLKINKLTCEHVYISSDITHDVCQKCGKKVFIGYHDF